MPVSLMVMRMKPVGMTLIPAIAMASYTTYKIVMASVNLKRRKKSENRLVRLLRTTGFIDALVSILTLQNTLIMVNAAGDGTEMLALSAVTSAAIMTAILALSVAALVTGIKNIRQNNMTALPADDPLQETVLPGAENFESAASKEELLDGEVYGSGFGRVYINEAMVGRDAAGNVVGYAVSVTSAEGYDGNVTLSLGVSAAGKINAISFTELHETPGKGMLWSEAEHLTKFNGKDAVKLTLGQDIDGITGVTITSKAVVNAVNAGLDFINTQLRGE
jgi:RnfABCDGE-type electron transport complex G subunit